MEGGEKLGRRKVIAVFVYSNMKFNLVTIDTKFWHEKWWLWDEKQPVWRGKKSHREDGERRERKKNHGKVWNWQRSCSPKILFVFFLLELRLNLKSKEKKNAIKWKEERKNGRNFCNQSKEKWKFIRGRLKSAREIVFDCSWKFVGAWLFDKVNWEESSWKGCLGKTFLNVLLHKCAGLMAKNRVKPSGWIKFVDAIYPRVQ